MHTQMKNKVQYLIAMWAKSIR